MKRTNGMLTLAFVFAAVPNPAHAGLGVSVTAPIRHGIDAFCSGTQRVKSPPYLFARTQMEGARMSAWARTTRAAEEKIQNNAHFIAGEIGSLQALGKKPVLATLAQVSGTGDGATEAEYCYRSGRLVRMRTTIDSVTDEMQWVGTMYFLEGQSLGPFLQSKDLTRHRTTNPTEPRFKEPVYTTPARLPFFPLFTAATKKDRL